MKPLINNNDVLDEPFNFYNEFDEIYNRHKPPIRQIPFGKRDILSQEEDKTKYALFPHSIIAAKEIKQIIYRNKKPNIVLADSVRNTKIIIIKTIKTKTPLINRGNVILISRCQCSKKMKIVSTRFNETGAQAQKHIITKRKECVSNFHAYNKVKVKRGLFYGNQTKSYVKYLHWKYRKQLDLSDKYDFPTSRLIKLI